MAFLFVTSLHDVSGQHKKNWEATPTVSRWCHLKGIKLRNWLWLICCCLLQTCSFHHTVNLVQRKKKQQKQAMYYSLTVGEWLTFWLWILPVEEEGRKTESVSTLGIVDSLANCIRTAFFVLFSVPPLFVLEFLHRVWDIFEDYFGDCNESTLKENYVIVFEVSLK